MSRIRPSGSNLKRMPRHSTSCPTIPAAQTASPKKSRNGIMNTRTRNTRAVRISPSAAIAATAAAKRTIKPARAISPVSANRRGKTPECGLGDEIAKVAGGAGNPDRSRPSDLMLPDISPRTRAKICFDYGVRQSDVLAQPGNSSAQLVVVGEILAYRRESAYRVQIRSAKCHGRAQREAAGRK